MWLPIRIPRRTRILTTLPKFSPTIRSLTTAVTQATSTSSPPQRIHVLQPNLLRARSVKKFADKMRRRRLGKIGGPSVIVQPPPYPYGPARHFKRTDRGLFGGASIQSGNNVSKRTKTKTRRRWLPNVQSQRLYSKALNQRIKLRVTRRALRTIEKSGGLDEYLLGEKPARIKELGLLGWKLRWAVMQSRPYRQRFVRECEQLGLLTGPHAAEVRAFIAEQNRRGRLVSLDTKIVRTGSKGFRDTYARHQTVNVRDLIADDPGSRDRAPLPEDPALAARIEETRAAFLRKMRSFRAYDELRARDEAEELMRENQKKAAGLREAGWRVPAHLEEPVDYRKFMKALPAPFTPPPRPTAAAAMPTATTATEADAASPVAADAPTTSAELIIAPADTTVPTEEALLSLGAKRADDFLHAMGFHDPKLVGKLDAHVADRLAADEAKAQAEAVVHLPRWQRHAQAKGLVQERRVGKKERVARAAAMAEMERGRILWEIGRLEAERQVKAQAVWV